MTISDLEDSAEAERRSGLRAYSTDEGGEPPSSGFREEKHQRPSLEKLARDQDKILAALRNGLDDLEAVLSWAAEANVRTLGKLEPTFYASRLTSRLDAQWLTDTRFSSRELNTSTGRAYRDELAVTVQRASDWAYRDFRESVTEYIDDQTAKTSIHAGPVAFRPALQEMETRQREALTKALTGFSTQRALSEWERDLQAATFGEYANQTDYPVAESRNSWAFGVMLNDHGEQLASRYQYLLKDVMPACIRGVRALRDKTNEAVDHDRTNAGENIDV